MNAFIRKYAKLQMFKCTFYATFGDFRLCAARAARPSGVSTAGSPAGAAAEKRKFRKLKIKKNKNKIINLFTN